ncbi:hypothetical protein ACQEVI_16730 [Promicromonospora sp. CA-289599]|uniref:hypothetical protein n=1 Tax=Promicromonospora sp. CA-289599 TaxID=3240014 RepID=UPI003D9246A4
MTTPTPQATDARSRTALPRFWQRWAAVLGLLALSPISAEYLVGYLDATGRPLDLLTGLVILGPLYGSVAVLIREVARRTGRGWPTILLLATAAGVIQAGLIDQSLFFRDFAADDPDWATQAPVTVIPGLGIDAASLLGYVGGHVIWSFAAPIAVIESCAPRIANRRWLGKPGIVAITVLWVLAAALLYSDTAADSTATAAQLVGAALVAAALIAAAFNVGRKQVPSPGKVPSWWFVGVLTAVVLYANQLLPATWLGVTANVAAAFALGWLLLRWSRREGWGRRQVLAVAGAALVVRASISFLVEPLGDVDLTTKYAVNAVLLVGVATLLLVAALRLRRAEANAC